MNRRQAREAAFEMIYELGYYDWEDIDGRIALAAECREYTADEYAVSAIHGVCEHRSDIDAAIAERTVGWKSDRLSRVSNAIMRLCTYELLYREDIPLSVSLNEAVELAKKFDHDNGLNFINGVLNAVAVSTGRREQ